MDATMRRRVRWAVRGALVLAAISIVLGALFNLLIALFQNEIPASAGLGYWAVFFLRSSLAWGLGALPFGAALGALASMIWRDDQDGTI